jgi:WD40 repeat protein
MPKKLRIFVSSPGDVNAIREIAAQTIERVAQDYARFFAIEPYLWEAYPMLGSGHFQDGIELPSTFDIVVLILGSQLGTPLPERTARREYRGIDGRTPVTGTEWEYEEALAAARVNGVPDLLVYRGRKESLNEILNGRDLADQSERQKLFDQFEKLEVFWSRHFRNREMFLGAYAEFENRVEFARKFEADLRARIESRLKGAPTHEAGQLEKLWALAPFRGLEAYEIEHAPIFFGRDHAVGKALLQLTSSGTVDRPFLIVLGASGSGKSSLVKAGVVPKLFVPRRVTGAHFLRFVVFRPSDTHQDQDIFTALAERLAKQRSAREGLSELLGEQGTIAGLASHLRGARSEPGYPFALALGRLATEARRRGAMMEFESPKIVMVIDQLEELFISDRFPKEERQAFVELMAGFVRSGFVWVIVTMRKDYWHRADETPELVHLSEGEGRLDLLPPSPSQYAQMIHRPAEAANLSFEVHAKTGIPLNEAIAEEVARDTGALPLLSYVLDQLYRVDAVEHGLAALTYVSYESLGRLEGVIATKAEAVLGGCSAEDQGALGSVLFSLIQISGHDGDVERAVSRRVPLANFAEGSPQRRLVEAFLDAKARLLVSDARDGKRPTVWLAHEALITRWARARDFVQRNAEAIKIRRRIEERFALWQQRTAEGQGAPRPGLLVGIDLEDGNRLLLDYRAEVDPHLVDFIERSEATAKRLRTRAIRIMAGVTTVVSVLAIAATVAGWFAEQQRREAEHERNRTFQAQLQLLTGTAADRLRERDVRAAENILLEVLSHRRRDRPPAADLGSIFQEARAMDLQVAQLSGHRGAVTSVSYSTDGKRILSASHDGTARIWDGTTGLQLVALPAAGGGLHAAAFAPDGTKIATASSDGNVRLWDARSANLLGTLKGHALAVNSVAFSPDGTRLVTASDDGSARVWDVAKQKQLAELSGHSLSVATAVFSPDGRRVVTASADKTARLWDAETGMPLLVLHGHTEAVHSAAFSPNGRRIVTASRDKRVWIWDSESGRQIGLLNGHLETVRWAAFSPSGNYVVTASEDHGARIWDATTDVQLRELAGHNDKVLAAVFSPDGKHVVTASDDATARLWLSAPPDQIGVLSGHSEIVTSAIFSPDDASVATTSGDGTAKIWNTLNGLALGTLTGHRNLVDSAQYSTDGKQLITSSYDGTVRIWDTTALTELASLDGHGAPMTAAVFSPDQSRIATASFDTTARIWNARGNVELLTLAGHAGVVRSVAYSPDGLHLVTASDDRTVRIWDAANGSLVFALVGHGDAVRSAVYSHDGKRIVTASNDRTARIWDAVDGKLLLILSGHLGPLRSATFSPDGRYVVTAAYDRTVRIWDAATGTPLAVLPIHGEGVRSAAYSSDGRLLVAASLDTTATLWNARISAPFNSQVDWLAAAVFDPLSAVERARLGLPLEPVSYTADKMGDCDRLAAAYYDPKRAAQGVTQQSIEVDAAASACTRELAQPGAPVRLTYQLGRVLRGKGDNEGARRRFEEALKAGYQTAAIDLADLLVQSGHSTPDVAEAVSLYERAWQNAIPVAASRLGELYEAQGSDMAKAWLWYEQGASRREPHALARLALRDETTALSESSETKRSALFLQAFKGYTVASVESEAKGWPDDARKHWRYRRATLARLLAHNDLMEEVARAYSLLTQP